MLDELHVQNVALIRDARFLPSAGLTVVTGESGSGKTALLSAIELLVGQRADAATVREGAAKATVEGRVFLNDGVPDGHIAVRKVGADGRSRASIDGSMATVGQLASVIGASIDLCGQHEQQSLLKSANHRLLLDAWAGEGVNRAKESYEQAFAEASAAACALEKVQEATRASSAQLDEARFVLQRIDEVNPSVEEYEDILAELPRAENAEALAQAGDAAYRNLAGEGGAVGSLNAAIMELDSMRAVDSSLDAVYTAIVDASYVLEDAAREMRVYRDSVECDPTALGRLQERMGAMQGLMRAYGPRMEDVLERRAQAAELIASVDDSQNRVAAAMRACEEAERRLAAAAEVLDAARREAAPRFAAEVNGSMAHLEMGSAELVCEFSALDRSQWTRDGSSKMEFFYRAAAGMTPRPLARIASGGEASRAMLAIKVALGSADKGETLVFDEVDAGVGGTAALALADVLCELAQTHQVIVVTHLAQVAVRAQAHYVVKKVANEKGIPETELSLLEGEQRIREIARMLSGDASEASLAHAREMMQKASDR
ncbi:MAG: DNA repair protein RecN [Slackia sp.]|nr:DNA repair protein RecN [Slackia sp.]